MEHVNAFAQCQLSIAADPLGASKKTCEWLAGLGCLSGKCIKPGKRPNPGQEMIIPVVRNFNILLQGAVMVKLNHVVAFAAFGLGALGAVCAQTASEQKSSDPFVERRLEKNEAKKEYKTGEISKEQYQKERAEENTKLKESGERGTFEQNLDVRPPVGASGNKR